MKHITKGEFEKNYCARSGITKEFYDKYYVTLPCACDYEECEGWAKIRNDPQSIDEHKRFYEPK